MQSTYDQRIFIYKAATNTFGDISILNIWNTSQVISISLVPGDFIYIASFLPFNHKYIKFVTPDVTVRNVIIEILNAPYEWSPVVNKIDYTIGNTKSGVIGWIPDRDKNWGLTSNSKTDIAAFQSVPTAPLLYDSYWMRFSFDAATSFTLNHIGQRFSTDLDLYQEYPLLASNVILSGWKAGKMDWEDQHIAAAMYISKDLIGKNLIFSNNQILDVSSLRSPAVHKTANIIYSGLGARNYAEEIKLSEQRYKDAMNQDKFGLDVNQNARRDRFESTLVTTGRASR